jgi:hypothetical protein
LIKSLASYGRENKDRLFVSTARLVSKAVFFLLAFFPPLPRPAIVNLTRSGVAPFSGRRHSLSEPRRPLLPMRLARAAPRPRTPSWVDPDNKLFCLFQGSGSAGLSPNIVRPLGIPVCLSPSPWTNLGYPACVQPSRVTGFVFKPATQPAGNLQDAQEKPFWRAHQLIPT